MNPAGCFVHSHGIDEPETADAQGRLQVRSTITALPRTRVIPVTPEYIHSECRSAVFGIYRQPEDHCTRTRPVAYLHMPKVD